MTTTIELPESFTGNRVFYQRREDGQGYDVICGRCGGTGYTVYQMVDNGVCFQCNGLKGALSTITNEKALQLYGAKVKRAEKKERERLAIVAERDARVARLVAAAPEVAELLQKVYDDAYNEGRHSSFLRQLSEQVFHAEGRDLTENQLAAVQRGISKKADDEANAVPVETGKQIITGEIVSIKGVENDFGYAVKVVVKDDRGFKVYGSLAKSLREEIYNVWYDAKGPGSKDKGYGSIVQDYGSEVWFESAKGARVQFNATVEASRDDKAFGFFSRPTKAQVI